MHTADLLVNEWSVELSPWQKCLVPGKFVIGKLGTGTFDCELKAESTDAPARGALLRSSVEAE